MVEVFITDVANREKAAEIIRILEHVYPELRVNFDMDETGLPFPEGHSVLRVEGKEIDDTSVLLLVKKMGVNCEVMQDYLPWNTSSNIH